MNKNKGFTLIELLVVIAIIGILAGIIIVSMDGTTTKANDARIKADLDSIRTQMELSKIDNVSYHYSNPSTVCADLIADIESNNGAVTYYFDDTAYCVFSSLGGGGSWCVDSTGYVGSTAACDSGNNTCASD